MRRRNAIEPFIGHLKSDGLLERSHLRRANGDAINVALAATGHNPAPAGLAQTSFRYGAA